MNDPINITEVSVLMDKDGGPVLSMKRDDNHIILTPMTPESYARYQTAMEDMFAAGRRLMDEIKETE